MPSYLHESHVMLFRNKPTLAAELIRGALHVEVPAHDQVRVVSADLTELQPAEYRADMVIELRHGDVPVLGIVMEVQLSVDERKKFVWPAYVANLRARLECPVCLLVVTADDAVARWAARRTQMDALNHFTPYVLAPSGVPEITNASEACANPELAVLSAVAHGQDDDIERAALIAMAAHAASIALDAERSRLYCDLIMTSLSEAARQALITMDARTYEYQSEFARRYVAEGRAGLVARQLTLRFGALSSEVQARIQRASITELDAMGERLLTAQTISEVLAQPADRGAQQTSR
jgi:uncharacterized protein DUF4351